MRLCHLFAALIVTVASASFAEASPKATTIDLDKVQTSYAQHNARRHAHRAPASRKATHRNTRSHSPHRVGRSYSQARHAYRVPGRGVYYGYPGRRAYNPYAYRYGYYGHPYGYDGPVRYNRIHGRPYYDVRDPNYR